MVRSGIQGAETGKSGNFITTIPYYPECNMHEAGKNIKRCLELLPEKGRIVHLPEKKDLTQYDSAGLPSKRRSYTFLKPSIRACEEGLGQKRPLVCV